MYRFVKVKKDRHDDSVKRIRDIEKEYKITFPKALKEYYMGYDNAPINLTKITVNGYQCEVAKIIPIIGEKQNFEKIHEADKKDGFIPSEFCPLARDRGGNYYYWNAKNGSVYLLLNDDIENPFEVSKDVRSFFELLNAANDGRHNGEN